MKIKTTNLPFSSQKGRIPLIMRLLALLLSTSVFSYSSGTVFPQNTIINIDQNRTASITEVLEMLQQQTNFSFVFTKDTFKKVPKLQLKKGEIEANELIKEIHSITKLDFELHNKNIITIKDLSKEKKQLHEVKGTITDNEGIPLLGASVLEKGTSNGIQTDFDGNFSLTVSDKNAVLVISFIGFITQEIEVNGQSTINIQLEESASVLDEVVITALGIERNKKTLSYAVSEVKGEQLADQAEADVLRSLSGKVAGVNISGSGGAAGSSTNIVIRGYNSATGNNQPLFIVDGIPFDNSTTNTASNLAGTSSTYSNRALDLDPNDIASVTVLKGGAAAALYGSRASNGVIVITTKSGSTTKKGMEIQISHTVGAENVSKLPDYQNKYGQGNYIDGEYTFSPVATESWGPAFDDPNLDGNGGLFLDNGIAKYVNFVGDEVPYKAFPNNVKEFYRTGLQRETSIQVQGSDGKNAFALTASNVSNDGYIPFTGLKRTSVKVSGHTNLENGFKIGASATYVNTHQDGILSGGINTLSSINRQVLFAPRSYDLTGFPYIDETTGEQLRYSFWDNPRWLAQEGPYVSDVNRVYGYVSADYKANNWLNFSYKIGLNTYNDARTQIIPRGSSNESGSIIDNNIIFTELSSDFIITGSQQLSENFNLRFVVGQNYNQRKTDNSNIRGSGIIKHGISRITNTQSIIADESTYSERRIVGIFSDLVLSYKDYLFLNLTGRNDWSSTLPKGKRSFFYPSISTTFNFTDALELNSDLLTFGKVRLAYTKIGNDADPYLLQTVNVINGSGSGLDFPFKGISGTEIGDNLGNENLKPEFTTEYEAGLELNLFKDRIGIDIAYYTKSTVDQIFSVRIPSATGYSTKTLNAGEITNKGWEVGLDLNILENPEGFNWNIYTTFAKNISKVVKLIDGLDQINPGARTSGFGNVLHVGLPYGVIEGDVQNRDENGNLLINATTGLPSIAPGLGIIGDPNPDFTMGINNTMSFKGFRLGFLFDWKKGGDILSLSNSYLRGFGLTKETAVDRDRTYILPGILADPNDATKPMLDANGNTIPNNVQISPERYWSGATNGTQTNQYRLSAEPLVFDATVFRLREVSLGYTFTKEMLKSLPFGSMSVTLLGRNLWFNAPNFPHLDPEVSTYGAGNAQGIEQYAPPAVKNVALNIKLSF